MDAIAADHKNFLRWSRKGSLLALDIAKGLVHLHANQVRRTGMVMHTYLVNACQNYGICLIACLSFCFDAHR